MGSTPDCGFCGYRELDWRREVWERENRHAGRWYPPIENRDRLGQPQCGRAKEATNLRHHFIEDTEKTLPGLEYFIPL